MNNSQSGTPSDTTVNHNLDVHTPAGSNEETKVLYPPLEETASNISDGFAGSEAGNLGNLLGQMEARRGSAPARLETAQQGGTANDLADRGFLGQESNSGQASSSEEHKSGSFHPEDDDDEMPALQKANPLDELE